MRLYPKRPVEERFWAFVNKDGPVPFFHPELGPCWLWTGSSCNPKDSQWRYGQFGITRSHIVRTHRYSYEMHVGPIPPKLFVCHHCNVTMCLRPSHLFIGTAKQNSEDMVAKGRSPKGDRQGLRVHPERAARGDRSGARLHPELYKGERNGAAKLTDDSVRAIRVAYAAGGITQDKLAKRYGVCRPLISHIVHYKVWKDVA